MWRVQNARPAGKCAGRCRPRGFVSRGTGDVRFRERRLYVERVTAVYGVGPTSTGEWTPMMDVYETKDCFYLVAELAGVRREDIRVEVDGNVVTLTGSRPFDRKGVALENYHRMEFSYGNFERTFTLPCAFDPDSVEVTLKEGVLTVRLPRQAVPRGREVRVKVE